MIFGKRLFLSALIMVLAGCYTQEKAPGQKAGSGEFPREIVDFVPYRGNPVFTGTGADTWDLMIRERGYILHEGDMYHLWYTGYNDGSSDTKYLGYATSPDGFTWTRWPGNPIFTGSWVEDMQVVKDGDTYYMFAEGRDDIAHMLTSTDRIHWEDQGSLDIRLTTGQRLSPGPYGTPSAIIEGATWYLFYERKDEGIWLATSTDRKVWTNVRDEPVIAMGPEPYDREAVALNQVIRYNDRYYGYYHACAERPWRDWTTCVAMSTDLITWKKYPGNPVVTGDKSSGILVSDGFRYRLYTMHPDVRVYFPKDYWPEDAHVVAPGAKLEPCAEKIPFAEGPACDPEGNLYFTEPFDNKILVRRPDGTISLFLEDPGGPNGMFFNRDGKLVVCESFSRRMVEIDSSGSKVILAERYDNKKLNGPNDVWVDPKGGIYFSDPDFGRFRDVEQDAQYVFYITPDRAKVMGVTKDIEMPNGVVGSPDGKLLYVTDTKPQKTYVYTINGDGTLSDRQLFADEGIDGMTVDVLGNVYITDSNNVSVYDPTGVKIETIKVPGQPTNICFGGKDRQTLFITTKKALYSIRMQVKG
ncbi:SMP-30/gluconolactonase/LRE family protein [bacterium]|nr:SMP-30/gluconolactonase/LRE family protein [bacterium]